jgi:phosphopantetheinyl transferase
MELTREIFSFSKKNTQVYITPNWIDLSKDASSILLIDEEKEKYVALRTEKRKKEFLLVRFLRNNFFPSKEIAYTESGAPYFKDKSYSISISHSSTLIALAASSEERIGIDIELIQDKIIKLGHKFMHLDEIARVNRSNEVIQYTSFWCAKEALYKWSNIGGLSFQNDLAVHCDASGNWHGKSTRISTNLIPLETLEFNNHILCFTY